MVKKDAMGDGWNKMPSEVLKVQHLRKAFGGLQALQDVMFKTLNGQIQSLIGPNGAGKTTTLNLINGIFPCDSGDISFNGQNIRYLPPHKITALGLGRTFQGGGLFHNMTVLDNVLVGFNCRMKSGFLLSMIRLRQASKEERLIRERAIGLLQWLDLATKKHLTIENLSLMEQRMVEIASALAIDPILLLLDEPSAGLNDTEIHTLERLLFEIRDRGVSILLIEHNMDLVMKVSDSIVVLNYGMTLAEGTPSEIQQDERVIKAYLGE